MASSVTDGVDSRFLSTKKISVFLDDANYLLWREQSFLDSRTVIPPQLLPDDDRVLQENPEFTLFEQQDSLLSSIKGFCDYLASCGEVISEHEHVTVILNGLPPEYESVITIITASQIPYNVQGVMTMVIDAEARHQATVFDARSLTNVITHQPADSANNSAATPAYRLPIAARGRGRGRSSGARI
ncbi:hypothetical protein J1N35_029565 [Gossypium stocksii]|uniref:Uncharacterized protein n=1 Tax=Gossypium stocksii TaxID=47602 RepID=A0A9D3UY03_9ROSI|nr:hypothetical protein J1N35_029565 [Gossypium stocksii]